MWERKQKKELTTGGSFFETLSHLIPNLEFPLLEDDAGLGYTVSLHIIMSGIHGFFRMKIKIHSLAERCI